MSGGWRRPRMKVYDYNQDFGGNYYQPMIQYINKKDVYGPFHTREDVYLPHRAEVCSDKYTNLRYNDKSCAAHNLNDFLVNAYSKQIKELNGSTVMALNLAIRKSTDNTFFVPEEASKLYRNYYCKQIQKLVDFGDFNYYSFY